MIEFLAGALALAFAIAGGHFLRFWRKTGDPLFASFAIAFGLFALNQTLVTMLGVSDERVGYTYVLRVIGFLFILYAIIRKNVGPKRQGG